jgi:ABC-type branched-subunit amino acid transport system ATPase component/ABC-type branched-subunit amino acid transport system permease subunit
MSHHLVFLLLGLANGAVFASLALALVVTYRSSGVLNFATGAIALLTAYMYAFFRQGQLLLPIPGLPRTVDLGVTLDFPAAAAASLALTALLGLALYGVVFRPLRTAPPVARAVASIGVMVVITGVILQRLGTSPVSVSNIFPARPFIVGSVRVSQDRIWFAVTIVLLAGALSAVFRYTRFGLHTRAAAESEKGAFISGISPDRIAAANWMLSAAVAGLAGILISPIVPLVPSAYTLFVVPALAAALLGGFQRLGPAVFGGLAIGMLQSEVAYLKSQHTWLPSSGLPELVPLILILVVLVVRARPLPSRGAIVQHTLGRAPRPSRLRSTTLLSLALAVVALSVLNGLWRAALVNSLIFAVVGLSLVVVTGYAGQVSLAQLTLAGVAGFLLGPMTTSWGIPFPLAPLLAALGATVIGVVVGLPALRIRGLPVAVVTFALAVALEAIWFQNTDLVSSSGKDVRGPALFGWNLRPGTGAAYPRIEFCLLVLAVLVAVALGVARLRTSRVGSAMLAVRANERSAAASGIDVVRTKLLAFAIAAFIAGIGGSLLAYKQGNVTFDSFDVLVGLGLFASVYLAGITSVSGGILAGVLASGGLIFFATQRWLSLGADWYQVLTGVGLVLTVIRNPEGIVGPIHELLDRTRTVRQPRPTASVPGAGEALALMPPLPVAAPALSLEHITVHYGGVVAVDDVGFDVPERSIVGLIGPNGAGKTSLIDAISGFTSASGSVRLAGRDLADLKPHQRVRAGLGRTFQAIELWDDLDVTENVLVGSAATAKRDPRQLDRMFDVLRLDTVRHRPAGELSQGQRQLVSIARALIGNPPVVLLDEPAAGLDSAETRWLADRLRDIRDDGTTILLIDHDMSLVLNLCDHIQVLDFGRLIASGPPVAIRANKVVAAAYLGTTHDRQPATTA